MKRLFPGMMLATVMVLGGCSASVSEYEITNRDVGLVTGSAVGAGIGAIIGHQVGNAGEGLAIGAAAGGILGGLVGYQEDKRDRDFERQDTILRRQQQELERQTRELEALKRQRYYDEQARVQGAKVVSASRSSGSDTLRRTSKGDSRDSGSLNGRYGGVDYRSDSEEIKLGNKTVKQEKGTARSASLKESLKRREAVASQETKPVTNYPEVSIKEPAGSSRFDVKLAPGLKRENMDNAADNAVSSTKGSAVKGSKYSGGYTPSTDEGNADARDDFRF